MFITKNEFSYQNFTHVHHVMNSILSTKFLTIMASIDWKWKHNIPKLMGCSEGSYKRQVHIVII